MFPEFMGNNFWKFVENSTVGLLKLQSTCPEQCFLSRSSFSFIQFLIFRKNNSDFRKRFLSGFLEKYSTSPDGRCLEKKLYLKQFYIPTSPSFSNFERKRKIIFGRKIFGKVLKNATQLFRETISGKQLLSVKSDFSSFDFGSDNIRKFLRKNRKVVNTELNVSIGVL